MTFAEAYKAWHKTQAAMNRHDGGEQGDWDAMLATEKEAVWDLIEARAGTLTEIRQRAEVLVSEAKNGVTADGRLIALALALVRDLNAHKKSDDAKGASFDARRVSDG